MASSILNPSSSVEKPASGENGHEEKAKKAALRSQEAEVRRQQNYSIESCQPNHTLFHSTSVPKTEIATGSAGKPVECNPKMVPSCVVPGEATADFPVPTSQVEDATKQVEGAVMTVPYAPAPMMMIMNKRQMRELLLHPLRAAVAGQFPDWILPETFNVRGVEVPLASLEQVIKIDWHSVLKSELAVLQSLPAKSWHMQFYTDEPDSTPPLWPDRPRLDCVLHFANGTYARCHPSAKLILSTEPMPTAAMITRMRRKTNLLKSLSQRSQNLQCSETSLDNLD